MKLTANFAIHLKILAVIKKDWKDQLSIPHQSIHQGMATAPYTLCQVNMIISDKKINHPYTLMVNVSLSLASTRNVLLQFFQSMKLAPTCIN